MQKTREYSYWGTTIVLWVLLFAKIVGGVEQAGDVLLFYVWFTVIVTVFVIFSDEAKEKLRKEGNLYSLQFHLAKALALSMGLAACGYIVTAFLAMVASLYIIGYRHENDLRMEKKP